MKLDEAIKAAKDALDEWDHRGSLECAVNDLLEAIEEHLAAERKSAETLLCLADLQAVARSPVGSQRHGGE